MIQGKIERYHRSIKNLILLDNYYLSAELEANISEWVDQCNNHRYHEAIDNVTPSDRFFGRDKKDPGTNMPIEVRSSIIFFATYTEICLFRLRKWTRS